MSQIDTQRVAVVGAAAMALLATGARVQRLTPERAARQDWKQAPEEPQYGDSRQQRRLKARREKKAARRVSP